jgi:hypothetical protein
VNLTVIENREIVGQSNYETLLRRHLPTLCILLVLAIVILRRPTEGAPAGA